MVDDWKKPVPGRSWWSMEGMEGLVVSRFGWLMITHLSVEKDESNKKCQYKPMDIHMLYIYIYYIVICMQFYDVFICTYLCIPALCNRRYEFVFFPILEIHGIFFPFRSHHFLGASDSWNLADARWTSTHVQHRRMGHVWKKLGCLGYIGDYTTQFFRDYNKPL